MLQHTIVLKERQKKSNSRRKSLFYRLGLLQRKYLSRNKQFIHSTFATQRSVSPFEKIFFLLFTVLNEVKFLRCILCRVVKNKMGVWLCD